MATTAEEALEELYEARSEPGEEGFRPYTVHVIHSAYVASDAGSALAFTEATPLTEANGQPPRVKWLKEEDVPIGSIPPNVVEIGPVTPNAVNLAILEPLRAQLYAGEVAQVMLTGPRHPDGEVYRVINLDDSRPLGWKIRAQAEAEAMQAFG